MEIVSGLVRESEARGRKEGEARGRKEVFRQLLETRFGQLSNWAEGRIDQAEESDLQQWVKRVFDADSLEAVFND